jgi:hypothetical protein
LPGKLAVGWEKVQSQEYIILRRPSILARRFRNAATSGGDCGMPARQKMNGAGALRDAPIQ